MRQRIIGAMLGMALVCGPAVAQMHKVEKPQQVVRAVGVYEWTGNLAKPAASRLVPVALFINGEFQDAGVYLPQPVPLALDTGNVYELKQAGADKGTVTLEYARHLQTANGDYEDSWMGYGSFKAPAPPKPLVAKRASSGPLPQINSSVKDTVDPDRPVLIRRAGSESTDNPPALSAPSATHASSTTAAAQMPAGENNPADDPDRPILKRPANESAGNAGSGSTTASSTTSTTAASTAPASPPETPTAGSSPESDPNRPTLKRGRPDQIAIGVQADAAGMDASLNNDPNRPILRPGRPAGETTGGNLPKLVGMPTDMHQMVAVSDAASREPHVFTREWEDATEQMAIRAKIETIARAKLAAYVTENVPESERASASARPSAKKTPAASRRRARALAATPEALMDEELRSYTLSYGGDPTYVYTAHTAGTGSALRYVTVVAQTDETGELRPVMTSVTDAAHLDRTPEMKFVDVVDADASNRASLLFELKEQSTRQFALYRVFAGQSQQIFLSGTTQ